MATSHTKTQKKARKLKTSSNRPGHSYDPEDHKLEDVKRVVDRGLDMDTLFLKPGYTINEFSKDIGIPVYHISECISPNIPAWGLFIYKSKTDSILCAKLTPAIGRNYG